MCPGLSGISRQLFRSRFRCCACIFPSRKNAVNLLSIISASQHPQEKLGEAYREFCVRIGRWLLSADLSPGWQIKIPTGIILLKFAVCAPPLPSFTKRYFLPPPPRTVGGQTGGRGGWGGCLPASPVFSSFHGSLHNSSTAEPKNSSKHSGME